MADLGYKNTMAVPKIEKVVLNVGVGRRTEEERGRIVKALELISGQHLAPRPAKKSISSFKLRQGQIVGYAVTLRGKRMNDFMSRFINIALPRTRDFRGVDSNSVDNQGNLTTAIREHIVFPEIAGEDTRTIFGFEVTIVTSARSKKEGVAFFKAMGFPFKK